MPFRHPLFRLAALAGALTFSALLLGGGAALIGWGMPALIRFNAAHHGLVGRLAWPLYYGSWLPIGIGIWLAYRHRGAGDEPGPATIRRLPLFGRDR